MSQIPETGPIVKILVSTNPRHPERGLNVLNTGIVAERGAKDVQAVLPHWALIELLLITLGWKNEHWVSTFKFCWF